jgi:hypothetical protein
LKNIFTRKLIVPLLSPFKNNKPLKDNYFFLGYAFFLGLGSQLFSGFRIGWMIEHPIKSKSKNPIKLDWMFNPRSMPIIQKS